MLQKTFKTAKASSCSTTKTLKKSRKSSSVNKKNLSSTFTKIINPSVAIGNNSVLTQRNSIHNKCKETKTNLESQQTVRNKSSSQKLPKNISKMKTDRKAEYTKLKAKQIEDELEKKNFIGKKQVKSQTKQEKIILDENRQFEESFNKVHLGGNLTKITNFLNDGVQPIPKAKNNFDSDLLEEIQKNQKQLIEKINCMEKQNCTQSLRSDQKINEIRQKHDEEVTLLKQELRLLNSKLNQEGSKNTFLEKKVEVGEKQFGDLRLKIQEKDQIINKIQNQNSNLQKQLKKAHDTINWHQSNANELQSNILGLKSTKQQLEQQLKKCEKQKIYIKQNCVQVLNILREQFGDQLKLFSL